MDRWALVLRETKARIRESLRHVDTAPVPRQPQPSRAAATAENAENVENVEVGFDDDGGDHDDGGGGACGSSSLAARAPPDTGARRSTWSAFAPREGPARIRAPPRAPSSPVVVGIPSSRPLRPWCATLSAIKGAYHDVPRLQLPSLSLLRRALRASARERNSVARVWTLAF